jgi:hypothetical protein
MEKIRSKSLTVLERLLLLKVSQAGHNFPSVFFAADAKQLQVAVLNSEKVLENKSMNVFS